MNKHADLFRMILIIYYLLIGSVLFSACSPLPIVTTPEPQTAEPTAAATEQPAWTAVAQETEAPSDQAVPTPDVTGKRIITMEIDFLHLQVIPSPGSIFLTDAVTEAAADPANADCLLNVMIALSGLSKGHEQEQLQSEALRLKELGFILAEPRCSQDGTAGIIALLTPDQVSSFPGDPEIGYIIRFVNRLDAFGLDLSAD